MSPLELVGAIASVWAGAALLGALLFMALKWRQPR
jgi:LPXTG-motif cell wall-anchored protein